MFDSKKDERILKLETDKARLEAKAEWFEAQIRALNQEVNTLRKTVDSEREFWTSELRNALTAVGPADVNAKTLDQLSEEAAAEMTDEQIEELQQDQQKFWQDWNYWHGDSIKYTPPVDEEPKHGDE